MSALRLNARMLTPTSKHIFMRPLLENNKKVLRQQLAKFSFEKSGLINNCKLLHGHVRTYSTKQYEPNFENMEDNIQFYNNLHIQQNRIQWREFSQNKMDNKNNNNEKGKLIVNPITKNLTYISNKPRNLDIDKKTLTLRHSIDKPLCILFAYMMAKKRHLLKYSKIYTDLGFDVLLIETTPWQLLWPTKGSQLVAADTLNFLYHNKENFSPMMIHGFSVGGYQWGEIMAIMSRELPKYQPLLDSIRVQIWDSAADISEIPVGLPKAIFPKNQTLQTALRNYAIYHLKTFYQIATVHYARSSNFFHFPLLKCPSLFMVSELDPVGSEKSNWSVKEDMESIGIKTSWKCWNDSYHVMHYLKHPDEYLELIFKHLQENNVLEDVAQKSGVAKL